MMLTGSVWPMRARLQEAEDRPKPLSRQQRIQGVRLSEKPRRPRFPLARYVATTWYLLSVGTRITSFEDSNHCDEEACSIVGPVVHSASRQACSCRQKRNVTGSRLLRRQYARSVRSF
jgi:hypothetical protein